MSLADDIVQVLHPRYSFAHNPLDLALIAKLRELVPALVCRHPDGKTARCRSRLLFTGSARTAKRTAAEILAQELGAPLYCIDLRKAVSKYVGETEKNLAGIFRAAEVSRGVLFFDEADALFGKRAGVMDVHDRYANMDTDLLLQRIEEYDGIAILATNISGNSDFAFLQDEHRHVVRFSKPPEDAGGQGKPACSSPGVYVEEFSPGSHIITGVSTGTAAFLGRAAQGPVNIAQPVASWAEFQRLYGAASPAGTYLAASVNGFFANGGERCFVLRVDDKGAADDYAAGLRVLRETDVNILCAPGIVSAGVQRAMLDHCEELKDRMCLLDPPNGALPADVLAARRLIESPHGYGAMYYPWIRPGRTRTAVPPSGHIAGLYARTDAERGVHKAPANDELANATGVVRQVNKADREKLSLRGINSLHSVPGKGVRVLGARTLADAPYWNYVNVRRLILYIEQSIRRGILWAVFEPMNERLWNDIRRSVENFLSGL